MYPKICSKIESSIDSDKPKFTPNKSYDCQTAGPLSFSYYWGYSSSSISKHMLITCCSSTIIESKVRHKEVTGSMKSTKQSQLKVCVKASRQSSVRFLSIWLNSQLMSGRLIVCLIRNSTQLVVRKRLIIFLKTRLSSHKHVYFLAFFASAVGRHGSSSL